MFDFSFWLRKTFPGSFRTRKRIDRKTKHRSIVLEQLEDRVVPTGAMAHPDFVVVPNYVMGHPDQGQGSAPNPQGAFAPSDIQDAYGIKPLLLLGDNGAGETIAVVDAYDDPYMVSSNKYNYDTSDLYTFDAQFGLPQFGTPGGPTFTKYGQIAGTTDFTTNTSNPNFPLPFYSLETALDVEWAHAIAPKANIILVETSDSSFGNLFAGEDFGATSTALGGAGANVVSLSYGSFTGFLTESSYDNDFDPLLYPEVTFLASAGDATSINPLTFLPGNARGDYAQSGYPSDSPNVVSVGGTSLEVAGVAPDPFAYASETAWFNGFEDGTAGGISNFESQPVYQSAAAAPYSTTARTTPDVSFDADPNTGVAVYDVLYGWQQVGGTSLSSPCWAGLVAIADQIRASSGESPLGGATQTLPQLYSIYSSVDYNDDFHDITEFSNGTFNAEPGYDLVSGIGTPVANFLEPDLANVHQLYFSADSGVNNFVLSDKSGVLYLSDNGVQVDYQPIASTSSIYINDGGTLAAPSDNSLTIDYSGGAFNIPITFDGGSGSGDHILTFDHGNFNSATYTYTGPNSGTVVAGNETITFKRTTFIADNNSYAKETFNLPSGAKAVFADDSNYYTNISEISSPNSAFVSTTFSSPTNTFAVNTSGGNSLVQLGEMDPKFDPVLESFNGQAGDTFQLIWQTAIASNTNVSITTATLDLKGLNPTINALLGNGIITNSSSGFVSVLTVGASGGSGTFSGIIQNGNLPISFRKAGSGTEVLTKQNTYTGITTVIGGVLAEATTNALPVGTLLTVTDPGVLDLDGNSQIVDSVVGTGTVTDSSSAGTSVFTVNNSTADTFVGNLTGGLALTKTGNGTLTLSSENSYSGVTIILAGTIADGIDDALPTETFLTVTSPGILDLAGFDQEVGRVVGTGTVTDSAATATFDVDNSSADTFIGLLTGSLGLAKTNNGTLTLTTANTYTGPTTISAGTLADGIANALPTETALTVTSPGIFDLAGFNQQVGSVSGTGSVTTSVAKTITFTVDNSTADTFAGVISGTGLGLTKTSAGTLTLTNDSTYTGPTIISAGTIAGGTSFVLPVSTALTVNGTFDLGGFNQQVASVVGTGTVTDSGTTATFTVNNSSADTFAGPLTGTLALAKTNSGKLTLTNTSTYSGNTAVSAGILEVDGSITSNVTVSGTGTLSGSGSTGTVTASAGTVAPGSATNDTLTTGSLNLGAGTFFNVQVGGNASGAYGQDDVTSGDVTLSTTGAGVTLNLSALSYIPQIGDEYVIVNNAGTTPINGLFVAGTGINAVAAGTPLPEGTILSTNLLGSGLAGTLTYNAGPNHDSVAIIVTPNFTLTIGNPTATIVAGQSVSYPVTYHDDVSFTTDLATMLQAITLNTTGSATGTIGVTGSGANYMVTISNITGDGSLGISIAAGTGTDVSNFTAPAAGPSTTFIVDNTAPSVSIGTPSASIANDTTTVTYSIRYADLHFASSNLTAGDINLIPTGTANGTIGLTGSGTSYTVTISNITGNGSLGISILKDTAVDQAGNEAAAAGPSATFIVDNTAPAVTISNPSASITANESVSYTISYFDLDFASSNLTTSDITLNSTGNASGTLSLSGSGTSYIATISNIAGNGTLSISIAADTAVDQIGNEAAAAGPSASFIVDNTAPTATISSPSASITAHNSVTYTITYNDANFGSSSLTTNDIILNSTGNASGTIGLSGSGASYTVTVSSITGNGTLGISVDADTAVDKAGNEAAGAGPSATFIVDNTAPTVAISSPSASITASGSVTYTVTYADANFGSSSLTTGDITLNSTGNADGVIGVSGSGTSYTVTISSITGDGSLGISVGPNTAVDQAGNKAGSAGPSGTFVVDNTPPTVTISNSSASITAGGPITYAITYADANFGSSNLTTSNIALNTTGTANGTLSLSGSGTSYTVTVSTITGDGTLSISVGPDSAVDLAGNEAGPAGPSATFIVDNTAPAVTIGAPSDAYAANGSITFPITYTDANFGSSNLTAGDITLNKSGTANGTVSVTGSGTSYVVTISRISGNGTLGISIAADTAVDQAGNEAAATGPGTTFIVDNIAPSVTIGAPSSSITNNKSITYSVTYADANFGSSNLTAGDITLNETGTAGGTVAVSGTGTSYTVTISSITGNGTLSISIAGDSAVDLAANEAAAAGPSAAFIVDNTAPAIAISNPSTSITAHSSITYTINYSDANFASSSLTAGNISLNRTGTANGTIGLSGSGTAYTVTISNVTGDGSLGISLAGGTAVDMAGNLALAAGPSAPFIVDNTAPGVDISSPSRSITSSGPITYTVSYPDANFGSSSLSASNITLNTTGTANGMVSVAGSGPAYTVTVSNITGDGSVGISIAADTAVDLAGNEAPAAGPSATFIVDNTAPTISISNSSASITAHSSVSYTVNYSDANFASSNLTVSDITLNKTGTANGTLSLSGSGTSYTVTISNITGDGSLGISIGANTAIDLARNKAAAAGPSATFIVDNTPPTVTIFNPPASFVSSGPLTFTVGYTDANFLSSTLSAANVHLVSTGTATGSLSFDSGNGAVRYVTISNITGNGTFALSIDAGSGVDLAGNLSPASGVGPAVNVSNVSPTVTISGPSVKSTVSGPVKYTVTYVDAHLNTNSISLTPAGVLLDTSNPNQSATITVTGTGNSRTVTLSNITGGTGSMGISIAGGTAFDIAGNPSLPSNPSATFKVTGTSKLTVSAASVATVVPGATLVETFTIANKGNQAALGVNLVQTPPAGTTVNLALNPGWTAGSNGTYLFDIGTLAAGASMRVTFNISVPSTTAVNTTLIDSLSVLDSIGLEAETTVKTSVATASGRRK